MAGITIQINGDVKNFQEALEEAQSKTAELSDALKGAAAVSAVAFAALTAEVGFAVAAYAESEEATNSLTNAMINQGVYSKDLVEQYKKIATEIQNLTGISDEAVLSAQTTIQAYIGQREVTKELTLAVADFAKAQGIDLATAAALLGKGIQGNTEMLKRYGIQVDDAGNKTENMANIIAAVNAKFSGSAQAAAEGFSGSINKLTQSFGDLQEEIGARFAPVLTMIANAITSFFQYLSNNKALMDLAAGVLAAGVAFTGMISVITAAGVAFLSLKALLIAAGVAFSTIAAPIAVVVAGIAAVSAGIGLLVVNWESAWPRMQAVFQAFVKNIGDLAKGLGQILLGVFTVDPEKIKEGLAQTKDALSRGFEDYSKITETKLAEIDKKHEEAETQKQERAEAGAAETRRREELEKERKEAVEIDLNEMDKHWKEQQIVDRATAYDNLLAQNEEFQALDAEQQQQFRDQNDAKNIETTESARTAQITAAQQRLADQQQANQKFLIEQQKYGTAYASINKFMHSEVMTGTKQATSEMIQFQQSSNATLKGIGKAAAVADIVIKTAQSAMNIYQGFSAIPIIGPALGIAGAAAAIAFGAEQIGKVTGAAQGGLLQGGIAGVDSIPVLAQRNELISPAQSFEDVIGSVRAAREAQRIAEETGFGGTGGGQAVSVAIGFDGKEASQVLTARQIEDRALGISQEMDV